MHTAPRTLAGLAAASVLAISLVGCSSNLDVFAAVSGEQEFTWSTAEAARDSDESFRIPGFLPDDATDVRVAAALRDFGSVMSWSSEAGITAEYCEAASISGDSEFTRDWWPEVPAEGWDCGRWLAFEHDGEYYAWDQGPDAG